MKKPLYLLPVFIAASISLYSQSFDLGISGGYCLPLASGFYSNNTIYSAMGNGYSPTQVNLAPFSYGNGGNVALNADWFFNKNIGLGLKFNALISAPLNSSASYTGGSGTINYNFTNKAYSYQLIPHINFKYDFRVVCPYIEMGMLIGFTHINEAYVAQDNNGNEATLSENLNGNIMLGFHASLGVAFRVSKAVRITLAVISNSGTYSPANYQVTSYTVNGANQMNTIPVSQQQGSFVKQLDPSTPANNNPGQAPKFSLPFSNIGINAGVCFVIPVKAREHVKGENKVNGFHGF